jgi:hypothetical protein
MDIETTTSLEELGSQDVIDSRDLVKLLANLEQGEQHDEDEAVLIKALHEIRDECESSGWAYGIGFIRDSYWWEYCQEFAVDVGYTKRDGNDRDSNPLDQCIDWEKWADLMMQDYQTIDIGGTEYYWREA